MNKEESIALFQSGEESWNAWAKDILARQDDGDDWKAESRVDFSSHVFDNADFSGFIFPGYADFSQATFSGNSWFIETRFMGAANFKNAVCENEICFITNFEGDAWFGDAIFKGDARFGKSVFHQVADFRKALYKGVASFTNSSFGDIVWFEDAIFFGYAMFNAITCRGSDTYFGAFFKDGATFEDATFQGNADYRAATFEDQALFTRTVFGGDARFGGFCGTAMFEDANFGGEAWFAKSTFKKLARFNNATFKRGARFENCTFEDDVAFSTVRFKGYAIFDQTEYRGRVSFQAVEGVSAFTMVNASFSDVPNFDQATFAEAPRLDNFRIALRHRAGINRTVIWDLIKENSVTNRRGKWRQLTERNRDVRVRWRTLRRLATQAHDHEREQLFFREEVLSARWISDKPWQAFFWCGVFYQLLSDFGRSVSRPILSWLIWWLGFCAIYLFLRHDLEGTDVGKACSQPDFGEPWIAALGLSLYRSLPVLSGLSDRIPGFHASLYGVGDPCVPLVPIAVSFLGVVQTVVSTGLLFLVLLALRNRFRIS